VSSRQQGVGSEASAAVSGQKKAVSRLCMVSSGHQAAVGIRSGLFAAECQEVIGVPDKI
jgi:hypothetical protein